MTNNGKLLLHLLKHTSSECGPKLVLRISGFEGYFLRLATASGNGPDPMDVSCLTDWRNQNMKSFLTEFVATEEQTSRWLAEVIHNDDTRAMFMIENTGGARVGYMGIAYIDWERSRVEADAVVSGGDTPKGMMSVALRTTLHWARWQLGLKRCAVRVLSDNPALAFYRKLGFIENKRVPLRRVISDESVSWIEDEALQSSERYLVHHNWNENED